MITPKECKPANQHGDPNTRDQDEKDNNDDYPTYRNKVSILILVIKTKTTHEGNSLQTTRKRLADKDAFVAEGGIRYADQ